MAVSVALILNETVGNVLGPACGGRSRLIRCCHRDIVLY